MSWNSEKNVGKRKNSAGGDEEMDDDGAKECFKKLLNTTSLSTGIGAMECKLQHKCMHHSSM